MGLSRKLANLGSAIDSGQTTEFLTIDDSGGLFREVQYSEIANRPTTLDSAAAIGLIDSSYIQARQVDVGLDSALITQLVDSSYVQARTSSTGLDSSQAINLIDSAYLSTKITAGLDSSGVTNLVDSSYVAARASTGSGFDTFQYTATANQTTFEDSDVNGEILSYTADGVLVFYNGILLDDTVEYTASTGTSVVLSEPADSGATLLISKWSLGSSGSSSSANHGDRGFYALSDTIEYYDITTTSNTADFADLYDPATSNPANFSSGTRAVFAGGSGANGVYQYITCATIANSQDFGDLLYSRYSASGCGDGTYGLTMGGYGDEGSGNGDMQNIEYVTIATTGNGTDFGDLDTGGDGRGGGSSANSTRGIRMAGQGEVRMIQYVTIASPGNAIDFGDLTADREYTSSCADSTRALCGGGDSNALTPGNTNTYNTNIIDYVTIDTPGNATDFGNLTDSKRRLDATANSTRGVFAGGTTGTGSPKVNNMDYVTIQTTGNASDFGDLLAANSSGSHTSGNAA